MAQDDDEEELVFNVEEVQKICRDNIELCLGGNMYSHSRTPQWITVITEKTLARLNKLNKPFKYIGKDLVVSKIDKTGQVSKFVVGPKRRTWLMVFAHTHSGPCTAVSGLSMIPGIIDTPDTAVATPLQVRMTVTQKNGSGLHTAAAYFWDIATDGACTVRWENKYMYCIINVWACALQL